MEEITRTDLCILAVLYQEQADSFMLALSINEILASTDVEASRITVYKHLKYLLNCEYVAAGAKNNRASCYYITDKGRKILKEDGEKNAEG